GADSLKVRFSPGRPRRLTRRQEKRLVRILLRGALANGYRTEVWTTKRVAEVIEKTFHVPCHYNTAGKLLHRLDWTPQKPERRALERDEQAIQRWKKKVWPRVKKNAARLGAHIVFADESGFLLAPLVVRTWAPIESRFHRQKLCEHPAARRFFLRLEEHTSELQSRGHIVCRL